MNYQEFLKSKEHSSGDFGFKANYLPDRAFDFQAFLIEKAVKKGRHAIFADTGLGKTLMQISIAYNIIKHTNKKVLIITPLAVAFQFIKEAEIIGIDDIEYSKNGKHTRNIVITNYERLHLFDSSDYVGVFCDESSILKNFEGKTKDQILSFIRKVDYRFEFTATPSPNDYIELGNASEALGYLGYMDMLSRFFKNNHNNTVKTSQAAMANAGCEWYLKPHAENDFWKWVSTWSTSIRKPSDLGFSDKGYELPPLKESISIIENHKILDQDGQMMLFNMPAIGFSDIKKEVRATIEKRCQKAVDLSKCHDTSVYWVNLNDEARLIREYDKEAKEIKGQMSIDEKEELLIGFSNGDIKKLITKSSITAFGLNWQHCNHTTYFPTYSFEQYYQSIRRFWRFGQKREVNVDLVISDGQKRIMQALQVKKDKANEMFKKLSDNTNSIYEIQRKEFNQSINKPKFL